MQTTLPEESSFVATCSQDALSKCTRRSFSLCSAHVDNRKTIDVFKLITFIELFLIIIFISLL